MRSVSEGDRGPAVEDIQRRLLALEYDLGPTGVDGVFLTTTADAVRSFQAAVGVPEDGVVGSETWAALVDATFTLGDRLLYLRFPYLHGRDVLTLQRVLNTIGFSCGDADGIFGAFTEHAVREYQHNVGAPADGIVGAETVTSLMQLRHIWEGREGDAPAAVRLTAARAADVLTRTRIALVASGPVAEQVAARVANVARASTPDAAIALSDTDVADDTDVAVEIVEGTEARTGTPVVTVDDGSLTSLTPRVVAALRSAESDDRGVRLVQVDLGAAPGTEERFLQTVAVGLTDGLCAGLL